LSADYIWQVRLLAQGLYREAETAGSQQAMTRTLHRRSPTGTYHLHLEYDAQESEWWLCIEEFEGLYRLHHADAQWMYLNGLPFKRHIGYDVPPPNDLSNLEDAP
jgi:hypothetical protein